MCSLAAMVPENAHLFDGLVRMVQHNGLVQGEVLHGGAAELGFGQALAELAAQLRELLRHLLLLAPHVVRPVALRLQLRVLGPPEDCIHIHEHEYIRVHTRM